MKWHTIPKAKVENVVLKTIDNKMASNNKELVIIKTVLKDFSNFKNIWDKQNIDIENLIEGDTLRITYYVNEWQGKKYNNFIKVEVVEKALSKKVLDGIQETKEKEKEKSDNEYENVVDEIINELN